MLEVPVYNSSGEKIDTWQVDEKLFGGEVNVPLLKQAVVAYHASSRQGTLATKSRGLVAGSTKKMFAQKHTGNARRGNIRTNVLKGGGVAFAKVPRDFRQGLPKKMKLAALNSALLAKMMGNDLLVVDGLKFEGPKTKQMVGFLKKMNIARSCLLATEGMDRSVYLSSRNIASLTVCPRAELNAFNVATRQKMLITAAAMKSLMAREAKA